MLGYAVGLYVNGNLGDKLNARYFLSFSLINVGIIYLILYYLGSI